jgi:hypothetical protein
MRKPDFFMVGAPKCGTSAMAHFLGTHPDVFMARKEMHFFGKDLKLAPKVYRRDMAAYLAEFEGWSGQARAGEASVWYLFSTEAAREIKAFTPDASIIIMLREPAEMLHSLYYQFYYDGNEDLPSFEEALEAEADRRAGRRIGRQAYLVQALAYREVARYSEQVRRYFEVFGRERVHVILYDDFVADVRETCRRAFRFLGVDPAKLPARFDIINSAKTVRIPALRAIMRNSALRATALAIRPRLPWLFAGLQRVESRLQKFNTRFHKRAALAPEMAARLRSEFAPEVERLGQLLGRDLSHWSSPLPAPVERNAQPENCLL